MKRIINPWEAGATEGGFGWRKDNPKGLQMEFFEDGDDIVAFWRPTPDFQSWPKTLHGGIQATLMDELSMWVVIRKLQTFGVTSKMEIRYHKPVSTDSERVTVRARIVRQRRTIIDIEASITDDKGEVCATGAFVFFTTPAEKVRREHNFQGCDVEQ